MGLLVFNVLFNLAPYEELVPLTDFARSGRLPFIVTGFGLAAAVAAGIAACALTLAHSLRRASALGPPATIAGSIGGILVCLGLLSVAGINLVDEAVGGGVPHPYRGALTTLSGAPMVVGVAFVGLWLSALGWLARRRRVLGPAAGTAAALAGGSLLAAAATIAVTSSSSYGVSIALMFVALGTVALGVWALIVAATRLPSQPETARVEPPA